MAVIAKGTALFYLFILLLCYLVGAVPTSYLLVKYMLGKDIRTMGSGNSGATNTGRFLGRAGFVAVLFVDALKAYVILALAHFLCGADPFIMLCATAAVYLGNAYSPFIGLSGGKGVATSVGIMLYLFPLWLFFLCLLIFAGLAYRFNRVDIASLGASAASPVLLLLARYGMHSVLSALAIAIWIWIRHTKNISSLMKELYAFFRSR
ncbi:MAG: acyl phosphate:glycerol-3-phosphate acyltransferase [Candidatus Dependentiae bacterium]|nr:acyl phosphate:glycerol-3-phosphate acyltransferase [Candidatus Dependentiae bacterium]